MKQITLEDLGLIPKQKQQIDRSKYASPCGGCICEHCENNVECSDKTMGKMVVPCFNCDDCYYYSGKGTDNWKSDCSSYEVTEKYAKAQRKRFKIIKQTM